MRTTEQWLSDHMAAYKKDPVKTLQELLIDVCSVMEDTMYNADSKASTSLVVSCLFHTYEFINRIEALEEE